MDVQLVMFKRDGQRKDLPVGSGTTVIGRGEECDLRIPLSEVSRKHCELTKGDDEVKAKDLASSNGTFVNNRRITESPLKAGDKLTVGPVTFTVQVDGQPQEITPVSSPAAATSGEEDEEIVELEADVTASDQEESDPIAALEALAGEMDEDKRKK